MNSRRPVHCHIRTTRTFPSSLTVTAAHPLLRPPQTPVATQVCKAVCPQCSLAAADLDALRASQYIMAASSPGLHCTRIATATSLHAPGRVQLRHGLARFSAHGSLSNKMLSIFNGVLSSKTHNARYVTQLPCRALQPTGSQPTPWCSASTASRMCRSRLRVLLVSVGDGGLSPPASWTPQLANESCCGLCSVACSLCMGVGWQPLLQHLCLLVGTYPSCRPACSACMLSRPLHVVNMLGTGPLALHLRASKEPHAQQTPPSKSSPHPA